MGEFLVGFLLSHKKKDFLKHHWYDLLGSIPITATVYRPLRALRLLRVARIIRMRHIGNLSEFVAEHTSRYVYLFTIAGVVIFSGATAFFTIEVDVNSRVNNFFDAIWWAASTSTGVGYGDIIPVTWEGRVVGMCLMFFGVALIGSIAGVVGSNLLDSRKKKM
jgi:voltage-gated potassium channel